LVHGAGSFGHILANKYKLDEGFKSPKQLAKVAEVKKDVRELNLKIIKILITHTLNPISISPSSIIVNKNKMIDSIDMKAFERPMELQFIPVTFGDIVMDKKLGFSICSGDQIILHLAKNFKPDKVVFVTNVDGLLTKPPTGPRSQDLIEDIDITSSSDLALVKSVKAKMKVADVTGGILTKLKISMEMAKFGIESYIINGSVKSRLKNCLLNRDITGTRIH
jgi:isopentenyl phosphate kinase